MIIGVYAFAPLRAIPHPDESLFQQRIEKYILVDDITGGQIGVHLDVMKAVKFFSTWNRSPVYSLTEESKVSYTQI